MQVCLGPVAQTAFWGLFVLLALAAAPRLGAVYYLAQDGDDRNAGNREAPWRSIEKANAALRPGDTAIFRPGTYEGRLAPASGGEPGSPIVFRSEEVHEAVLVGGERGHLVVELDGTDHVVLEGFRVSPGDGRWLRAEDCDGLTIRGCYMERAGHRGTSLSITRCGNVRLIDNVFKRDYPVGNMCNLIGCTYVVVEGNAFTRVGHCPLLLDTVNFAVVRGNCFHNCWGRNYELWASGRVLVEGNVITEALDSARSADTRAKNVLIDSIIRFNRAFGNRHTPMDSPSYMPRMTWTPHIRDPFRLVNTRIYHNTITDNLGYGWDLWGINVSANVFVNNVFCRNDPYGSGVQITITESVVGDNRFFNNLLRGTADGQRTLRRGKTFMTAEEANEKSP
ncbi:MAG: right-handed parallel beta-helix repeat-containing protein [Candidatus Latescibacteria bacterium]|nr:right-handed parallel beta-helix repeat-containing protein [Candidatus Latescibacterota bacterium]